MLMKWAIGVVGVVCLAPAWGSAQDTLAPDGPPEYLALSCDNPMAGVNAPCFPPNDPKHMTIGLYGEPSRGVARTRIKDPGDGVPVRVLERRQVHGDEWLKVETLDGGHTGWIGAHLVKTVGGR